MKDIEKNRFFVWLMYLVPITLTGWTSVIAWTVIQIMLCKKEKENRIEKKMPLKERRDIVVKNIPENLNEKDLEIMKKTGATIKLREGVYVFDWK